MVWVHGYHRSRWASAWRLAVFGVALLAIFNAAFGNKLDAIDLTLEDQRENLAGAEVPWGIDPALARTLRRAIDLAFVESFWWVMLIGAILAAQISIADMFTIGNPPKPEPALFPQAPQTA